MRVLAFSKDRSIQLLAMLDSLRYYSNVKDIDIIVPKMDDIIEPYKNVCNWHIEYPNFDSSLRALVNSFYDDELVLFQTDDVISIESIDIERIEKILQDPTILGYSLRLGINILGSSRIINESGSENWCKWKWNGGVGHWGYPIDLSCSVYRGKTIKDIVNFSQESLPIPNSLESRGVNMCYNGQIKEQYMSCDLYPTQIIMDVNRCQDLFPNKHHGTDFTSIENLKKLYNEGREIDWGSYKGILVNDCFCGGLGLKFK